MLRRNGHGKILKSTSSVIRIDMRWTTPHSSLPHRLLKASMNRDAALPWHIPAWVDRMLNVPNLHLEHNFKLVARNNIIQK